MSTVQEKIDGLLALYRRGVYEGERTQAHRALVKLCAKHGLNIDDVTREGQPRERYMVKCKNEDEAKVFAQVVFKYADPEDDRVGIPYKGVQYRTFKCTPAKFVELMAAWSVLKQAWRDEQDTFRLAFIGANHLWGKHKEGDPEPEITPEELRRRRRAAEMATFVQVPEVHKQLSGPSA